LQFSRYASAQCGYEMMRSNKLGEKGLTLQTDSSVLQFCDSLNR
jgi:hypothetical protein